MPALWSNPEPGPSPAVLQHAFEVHAAPISGVLEAIMRGRQQQQQQTSQALQGAEKGIAGYMDRQKQDQIAQTLLDNESNYNNSSPTDLESIARTLNESDVRPSMAYAAFDKEKTDRMKEALQQAETARYNAMAARGGGSAPPAPMYDADGNVIGYSSGASGAPHFLPKGQPDKWSGAIPVARGWMGTDGGFTNIASKAGKPEGADASEGDMVQLAFPGGKTMTVPWSSYQGRSPSGSAPPPEAIPPDSLQNAAPPADIGTQTPAVTPPQAAIDYLRAHPEMSPQFDAKYGDGLASSILGQ